MNNGATCILRALEEALAHAQGHPDEGLIVHVPVGGDVSAIRSRAELSQADDRPPIARKKSNG